jgi:hypothetical protein
MMSLCKTEWVGRVVWIHYGTEAGIKIKEYDLYQSAYCGLCKELGRGSGLCPGCS